MSTVTVLGVLEGLAKFAIASALSVVVTPCIILGFVAGLGWKGLSMGARVADELVEELFQ